MSETTSAPATPAVEKQTQRQQPKRELTRQQKAAAVIVSLGAEKASQLYQYMDP